MLRVLKSKPQLLTLGLTEGLLGAAKDGESALIQCVGQVRNFSLGVVSPAVIAAINWDFVETLSSSGGNVAAGLIPVFEKKQLPRLTSFELPHMEHERDPYRLLELLRGIGAVRLKSISLRSRYGGYWREIKAASLAYPNSVQRLMLETIDPRGHDPLKQLFGLVGAPGLFGGNDDEEEPAPECSLWPTFSAKCLENLALPLCTVRISYSWAGVWYVCAQRALQEKLSVSIAAWAQLFSDSYENGAEGARDRVLSLCALVARSGSKMKPEILEWCSQTLRSEISKLGAIHDSRFIAVAKKMILDRYGVLSPTLKASIDTIAECFDELSISLGK